MQNGSPVVSDTEGFIAGVYTRSEDIESPYSSTVSTAAIADPSVWASSSCKSPAFTNGQLCMVDADAMGARSLKLQLSARQICMLALCALLKLMLSRSNVQSA